VLRTASGTSSQWHRLRPSRFSTSYAWPWAAHGIPRSTRSSGSIHLGDSQGGLPVTFRLSPGFPRRKLNFPMNYSGRAVASRLGPLNPRGLLLDADLTWNNRQSKGRRMAWLWLFIYIRSTSAGHSLCRLHMPSSKVSYKISGCPQTTTAFRYSSQMSSRQICNLAQLRWTLLSNGTSWFSTINRYIQATKWPSSWASSLTYSPQPTSWPSQG